MRTSKLNQAGAAHLVAILAVVVVVAVAFAGYRVMQANQTANDAVTTSAKKTASSPSSSVTSADAPAKIETKADVQQAAKTLDADALESDLDPAQLDADLNSLL